MYHVYKISGPYLVIVPLTTLTNWLKEFKKWAPELYVVAYIGDAKSRETIRQHELFITKNNVKQFKFNVLLTTYELINKDCMLPAKIGISNILDDHLNRIKYSYLMVDEAHRLKNDQSKLYQILISFYTHGRMLITGTPLQNSLKELWCLLHFLMPSKFDSLEHFESQYKNLEEQEHISKLHTELAPHILRRMKIDVEKVLV